MHEDWISLQALEWAVEALDAAATDLTLAVLFARGSDVRTDASRLAVAVEADLAALCASLDRHA